MWTVRHRVGKLVEARLTTTDSAQVAACLKAIADTVASAPCPVVGILDLSKIRVFGRPDAELFVSVMRADNPRVERTAILVSGDPLFEMQMERLVRAAAPARRQVFRVPAKAVRWLAECLGPEEIAAARAFAAS